MGFSIRFYHTKKTVSPENKRTAGNRHAVNSTRGIRAPSFVG